MRLLFTPKAIDDVARLQAFVAVKNPLAAQNLAQNLLDSIDHLKQFSEMGVQIEQALDNTVRDLIVKPYVVRYMLRGNVIAILRIWHEKEQRPIV